MKELNSLQESVGLAKAVSDDVVDSFTPLRKKGCLFGIGKRDSKILKSYGEAIRAIQCQSQSLTVEYLTYVKAAGMRR
ncbi:hypothetical protein D0Z70_08285 [Sphingobium terrigena]|uniref:Uncharacterized protein n=1 Tax=Sphingobium terrigena TaxID=2304063 RepID=A0A418YTL4_9SPHN|nr:hypothetical protein D0Z70_08285 [Sphingobium terrigena]